MSLRGRRRLGFFVWIVGVAIAVPWGMATQQRGPMLPAVARAVSMDVSAAQTGRLSTVRVELHQPVQAGELVAELDDRALNALREVAAAEFLATSNVGDADPDTHTDALRRQAATLQLQTELTMLDRRIDTLKSLVADGAASQSEVDELALERSSLLARIRAKTGEQVGGDHATDGVSAWAVIAALKRLDEVDARLDQLKLTSTIDGRVSAVWRRSGEVVRRGDPIVRITKPSTDEVVAYAPPHKVPAPGAKSTVVRADGSELPGSVVSVSPSADPLPEALWTVPGRPEHGVAILVRVEGATMVPNEPLRVRL